MNIVVGYLPTREGSAAMDHAVAQAKRLDGRVVVVNTGKNGDNSDRSFASPQDLDAIDQELTIAGIEHEIRQVTSGDSAAEALIAAATEVSADLIVIGIRRRSPVGKIITGSTAQAVLMDAACPVLSVKPASPRSSRPQGSPARKETPRARPDRRSPTSVLPDPRLNRRLRRRWPTGRA